MADKLKDVHRTLITANHILAHHGVVDAYGHISARHPLDPSIYIMCGYMAPALVTSPSDLIEYRVSDSSTVDPAAAKGYSERFIHGELYRMFSGVNCVIHSHAEDVLPFVVSGVRLRAVYHMAGFLGASVPVFDINPYYNAITPPTEAPKRGMLVNNAMLGTALASHFSLSAPLTPDAAASSFATASPPPTRQAGQPDIPVVLMRRHGFTAVAASVQTAVYRAIYTKINAKAQSTALTLLENVSDREKTDLAFDLGADGAEGVGLTDDQVVGCGIMNEGFEDKPWRLWVKEVEGRGIYVNRLA